MPSSSPLTAPDLALLGAAPLFRGLPTDALQAIAQAGRRTSFTESEVIFHEGRPADAALFLLRGSAKLVQASAEGQAVVVRVIGPGELMGLVAVLEGSSYPASALAMETCEAVRWPGAALKRLIDGYPRIAQNLVPILVGRIHEVQAHYRELATERVERRIARALLRLVRQSGEKVEGGVRIGMRLTRQDLAEMAGTTLFTVSRVLSRWEEEGLVGTVRRHVVVRAPHRLVSIAEDLPEPSPTLRNSKDPGAGRP